MRLLPDSASLQFGGIRHGLGGGPEISEEAQSFDWASLGYPRSSAAVT